jgi:hypothetical protein
MFPLEFPLRVIQNHQRQDSIVLDPFCGRGTTIYAARRLGLNSYGFDSSPIATAIARAKLARAPLSDVIALGEEMISKPPTSIPRAPFFHRAYARKTLKELCSLREGLLTEQRASNASAILRAAALGCLHGPLPAEGATPSYFSNQMPRTFSSKPEYSLKFWQESALYPPSVSVMNVIRKKLSRIDDLNSTSWGRIGNIKCKDARKPGAFRDLPKVSIIVTSPPYYGMRTYVQDQWLRMWFLGGSDEVDYGSKDQLSHRGHEAFIADLAAVWRNVRKHSSNEAHLYVRFGALPSAKSDPKHIIKSSLAKAGGWSLVSVRNAATSEAGKRQADQMGRGSAAVDEYDFHAFRN